MEAKRKLNNGSEIVAVTSFLSLTYKPVKQAFDYADYSFPEQFCSKNGKLDTSRKFINIGGHTQKYKTNNDYVDYGKQLKRMHKNKRNSQRPCDGNINNVVPNDERKPDNGQPLVFVPPKTKPFVYKRNKTFAKGLSSLDFRVAKLQSLEYEDDDGDEQWGFFDSSGQRDSAVVQGFDSVEKKTKTLKKVSKFKHLNVTAAPLEVQVPVTGCIENERNQIAASILNDVTELEKQINDLLTFRAHLATQLPRIQGGSITTMKKIEKAVDKVDLEQTLQQAVEVIKKAHDKSEKLEQTIDKVHEIVVEKQTLDDASSLISNVSSFTSAFGNVYETCKAFVSEAISILASYEAALFKLFGPFGGLIKALTQALLLHFVVNKLFSLLGDDYGFAWRELVSLLGTVLINTTWNGLSWRNALVSGLRMSLMSCTFGFIHNNVDKVQGKDSYAIPFATCLGMALCAASGTSFSEKFFNSIKCFGGIVAFSTKFDLVLRSIYDIIPNVVKEYCQHYIPGAYELIVLGWYDTAFNKDYNELYELLKLPDRIYYSSHNVKRFLDLFAAMQEDYIPKYGHFSFFQKSTFFDKVDCVYEEVKRRGLLPGRRHCPFVLWIAGDSGVGKSSLAQYLAMNLIDKDLAYDKQVYSWNPALEYQDGYNNQPIVILNDYMQTTDNGEEQLLISMKDACDWMLNSSSVDDIKMGKKGEMRFTSKLVIITSNMTYLHNSPYIRDTGAFNRRRDLLVHMQFKGEARFDHDNTDYRWCDFSKLDPVHNQKPPERIYGISSLLDTIKIRYAEHNKISQQRVNCGLKIQGDEEIFEDAVSAGPLRARIYEKFLLAKESAWDFIKNHYKLIIAGATICTIPAYLVLKFVFASKGFIQAFNSGDSVTVAKVHKVVANRLVKSRVQGTAILNDEAILAKVEANLFRITTSIRVDGMAHVRSVNCLYIGDDKILCPKHVFYRGAQRATLGDMILVNKGEIIYETTFDPKRLQEAEEDYAFYNVAFVMPRYKTIDKLFDDGVQPLDEVVNIMILRQAFDAETITRYCVDARFTKNVTCHDDVGSSKAYKGSVMLKFRGPLAYGDCGSPLLAQIGGNWKILGIHVGGSDSVNYGQLVNVGCCKRQDAPNIQGFTEIYDHKHDYGQFIVKAVVDSKAFPFSNTTTKITKSICYEVLQPHTTEPCILSPNDVRNVNKISPLHEGTIQLGKLMDPISTVDYGEILQYLRVRHRCMHSKNYDLLDLKQAINGIEGLDRLDFQTSPGYPYTMSKIKKMDMFSYDEKTQTWNPTAIFMNEYDNFIQEAKQYGLRIIWTNCAKDERRPIAKIAKTRIFTISNIVFTVFGRQIFGKYVSNYTKTRHLHGGMVGINPYSSEWHHLYETLSEFANANDGDYSKYDKDLLKEVFELFSLYVKDLIPNVDFHGRSTHFWIDEILQCTLFSDTLTILDGKKVLITPQHGNPSGWFLTVFFNDFANKVYMYLAWMKLNPTLEDRISKYIDNVKIVFYGDDNLYTVSDVFKDVFNTTTVSKVLKNEYNITYTAGDKSDTLSCNKSIMECTFLKNHFVPHYSGSIVAGLDKNTIQEMVSWTKDNDKSLDMILNTCLRFSYFWGPSYFQQNYDKLREYCDELITYKELDYEFQSIKGLSFELYDKMENKRYEQLMSQLRDVKISNNQIKVKSVGHSEGLRDDKAVRSMMRNYGVNMVNQNIQDVVEIPNIVPTVQIPEVASTLKKLLSRPILVKNIEVPASTMGYVDTLSFPNAWVAASKTIQEISSAYFYFRGQIKCQVTLQSTPFNAGAMVAHFSYKNASSYPDNPIDSLTNAWLRPHIELDYSDNGANKVLDIPWKFKKEYVDFDVAPSDNIGNLYFDNYIPNTQTARLLVYMWVENAEVVVTRISRPPVVQGLTLFGDNVTNVNTQVGSVAGNICPANITGDKFDTKNELSLSALDQPTIPLEPQVATINRIGTSANADQIEQKEKLMLHPREQTMSNFETFGCPEDEMSIDYLKRKWSLLELTTKMPNTFKMVYGISTNPYDVLGAIAVGPNSGYLKFRTELATGAANSTFLDYISRNHTFWRGSRGKDGAMEYRFKFGCNRFQSGRIAVVYNPLATWKDFFGTFNGTTGLTFTQDQLGACYVAYFDINGQNNDIIVRTPYVSNTPWKVIFDGNAINLTEGLSPAYDLAFCGVMAIVAITPLVSPAGQATTIDIVPFVRGAPGYQIASPSVRNNAIGALTVSPGGESLQRIPTAIFDPPIEVDTTTRSTFNPNLLEKLRVQSKNKKIKVDCWEILRQLIRIPKVEFELPYYKDEVEEEPKVQGDDYVFLGDTGDDKAVDNDIIPTTTVRDLMKVRNPYVELSLPPYVYKIAVNPTSSLNSLYSLRIGNVYALPIRPDLFSPIDRTKAQRMPALMQWGGMYQGYRGSMKIRIRVEWKKNQANANAIVPIRVKDGFVVVAYLDEGYYNHAIQTSRTFSEATGRELILDYSNPMFPSAVEKILFQTQFNETQFLNYFSSQFPGLFAMETTLNDNAILDIEVPSHTFNKYHEIGFDEYTTFAAGISQAVRNRQEAFPYLRIAVYTNALYQDAASNLTALDIANNLNFRASYGSANIDLQTWISIGDETRFGVLDEYPTIIQFGTSNYVNETPTVESAPILPVATA